ncbi:hypothetical protein A7981_08485 [Methylovorus sp. MM2]|uniref:hypothetical protein n=1 Tax=Methylovorus sp. MM2 TaxID=1848038 RepID=UPI0007E04C3E|nr:hypothetical protein [Methylovorus sp. MM2]OAM51517.1 hypothetical protein A7981_08485 [Methylovorus sp. MM2]
MQIIQTRTITGWRKQEIDRVYDIAADMDGYYFNELLSASRQKDYARAFYYKRMQYDGDKIRERVRAQMKSETGRNNQVTVMNAILRFNTGRAPHPQATILSAETFDKVRAKLVEMGKLTQTTNAMTGADYIHWVTHTLPEYEKGQPRFGAKHGYRK